jgi:mannitol/fructose-specific phosphotransferase system IIA component (Ntr-type)
MGSRVAVTVRPVELAAYFSAASIGLDIEVTRREDVLDAMVGLLGIAGRPRVTLLRLLNRREILGSTGVGRGVAIPHCRSLVTPRVRMAYARLKTPLVWDTANQEPIRHVFLIVAPPVEVSNQYLPALGRLAQLARQPTVTHRLDQAATVEDVLDVLDSLDH